MTSYAEITTTFHLFNHGDKSYSHMVVTLWFMMISMSKMNLYSAF